MKKIFLTLIFLLISILLSLQVEADGPHDIEDENLIGYIETDNIPKEFNDPTYNLGDVEFSHDNNLMAVTGTYDCYLYVYNTTDFSLETSISLGTEDPYHNYTDHLDFSEDDTYLAVTYASSTTTEQVHVYWTSNWTLKANITSSTGFQDVDFSPNGSWLAISNWDEKIFIYDVPSFSLNTTIDPNNNPSYDTLEFSPNSEYLVCGMNNVGINRDVYIYWTSNWTYKTKIGDTVFPQPYVTLGFSPDSRWLAMGEDAETSIEIYNGTTFAFERHVYLNHYDAGTPFVTDIVFSSDSNFMAVTIDSDVTSDIFIFNTTTWDLTDTIHNSSEMGYGTFSSNMQYIGYKEWTNATLISFFNVSRVATISPEFNNFSFTPTRNYTGNVTFKVPVSNNTAGINLVTNNTDSESATEVNDLDSLVNNSFWFDSANKYVYIRTINLTTTTSVDWTINCSSGATFNILMPQYLEVGDYFFASGLIQDANSDPIEGFIATTRVYYNGVEVLDTPHKWNCSDGNYWCVIPTTSFIPGVYTVSIEFEDTSTGIVYKEGGTLYMSVDPTGGIHISTYLSFHFYDNSSGLGIESEKFKIYADNNLPLDNSDRIYDNKIKTYTGDTIYYRIDDYFNNQVYPDTGTYETRHVISTNQHENIPITWYDITIKNLNETIMYFVMTNGSRQYTVNLFPMDSKTINVLPGDYIITKQYYSAFNGSLLSSDTDTITISSDMFYITTGYNAMAHISWYNTNEGLGLPDETLKLYINGSRQTSQTYWGYINTSINVTIKDYYNLTLYTGNFSLNTSYTFLDFGLTFHSYKFCNLNDEYYMISFLRSGGSRWFERGICPYETVEFILPSGSYQLRIYDANNVNLYTNNSINMINSKLYVLNGSYLQLVIDGQSIITGQLLELSSELDYALMPDVEIIGTNVPLLFCTMDKEGMALGNEMILIDPSIIVQAKTRVETDGNWINSTARMPGNNSVANGTITLLSDKIDIRGTWNTTWINVTYSDNGTLFKNFSYNSIVFYVAGQNFTINGSHDLHIVRETKFNQQKKFSWSYKASTGFYTSGRDITNPMNVPMYDVYVFMEFDNHTNPDISTIVLKDIYNDGKVLVRGVNYDASPIGINFYIPNIDSGATRSFTIDYYKEFSSSYYYGEEQVEAGYIDKGKVFNDEFYNYADPLWINDRDKIFRGGLIIKFDETKITEIEKDSVIIYDLDNNILVDSRNYIVGDTFVRISYDAMGDVPAGGGRTFGIYFQEAEYPGADPEIIHLSTPIVNFLGLPITPFLLIFIICMCAIIVGFVIFVKKNKFTDTSKILIGVGVCCSVIFFLLQNMGI